MTGPGVAALMILGLAALLLLGAALVVWLAGRRP